MVYLTTPSVPEDYTEWRFKMIVANEFEGIWKETFVA